MRVAIGLRGERVVRFSQFDGDRVDLRGRLGLVRGAEARLVGGTRFRCALVDQRAIRGAFAFERGFQLDFQLGLERCFLLGQLLGGELLHLVAEGVALGLGLDAQALALGVQLGLRLRLQVGENTLVLGLEARAHCLFLRVERLGGELLDLRAKRLLLALVLGANALRVGGERGVGEGLALGAKGVLCALRVDAKGGRLRLDLARDQRGVLAARAAGRRRRREQLLNGGLVLGGHFGARRGEFGLRGLLGRLVMGSVRCVDGVNSE